MGVETMVQSNEAVNSALPGNIDASFAAEAGNILRSIRPRPNTRLLKT